MVNKLLSFDRCRFVEHKINKDIPNERKENQQWQEHHLWQMMVWAEGLCHNRVKWGMITEMARLAWKMFDSANKIDVKQMGSNKMENLLLSTTETHNTHTHISYQESQNDLFGLYSEWCWRFSLLSASKKNLFCPFFAFHSPLENA